MWMRIPHFFTGFFLHVICVLGATTGVSLSLETDIVKGRRSWLVLGECLVELGLFIKNENSVGLGFCLGEDLGVHSKSVLGRGFLEGSFGEVFINYNAFHFNLSYLLKISF